MVGPQSPSLRGPGTGVVDASVTVHLLRRASEWPAHEDLEPWHRNGGTEGE